MLRIMRVFAASFRMVLFMFLLLISKHEHSWILLGAHILCVGAPCASFGYGLTLPLAVMSSEPAVGAAGVVTDRAVLAAEMFPETSYALTV